MGFKLNPFTGTFDIDNVAAATTDVISGTINAGDLDFVDSNIATGFVNCFYNISLYTVNKSEFLNMSVSLDSADLHDSVFGRVGSRILKQVNAVVDGLNISLRIENNEDIDLNYYIVKNKLP